jgi:predicted RNase H-like HicB family nuclease
MRKQGVEYTVIVHEAEEGGYWTEVPGLPGAGSQGETLEEAIANTKESIEAVIEVMREKGERIPIPRDIVVKVTVAA